MTFEWDVEWNACARRRVAPSGWDHEIQIKLRKMNETIRVWFEPQKLMHRDTSWPEDQTCAVHANFIKQNASFRQWRESHQHSAISDKRIDSKRSNVVSSSVLQRFDGVTNYRWLNGFKLNQSAKRNSSGQNQDKRKVWERKKHRIGRHALHFELGWVRWQRCWLGWRPVLNMHEVLAPSLHWRFVCSTACIHF